MKFDMKEVEVKFENGLEIFLFNGEKINGVIFCQYNSFCSFEFEVKNGLKDGVEKEYLNNLILTKSTNYKNGMEEGESKEYFDSGNLKEEMYFEKGELIWSNVYDESEQIIERYEIDKNNFQSKN